jgi:hypothetical protein
MMHKGSAALVAIACWIGLALNFLATKSGGHDSVATLWILARYFTILTNLLVAVTMTWVAIGGRPSAVTLGGITLANLLVGIVYAILLKGLHELHGAAATADFLLHDVTPVLMALWWLFFAPRGKLRWSACLWWSAYPLAYLVYALVRGGMDGKYPYPFIDVGKLGWLQTALNSGGIALGFIIAGLALVWIDSWRPLGSGRSSR